MNILPTLTLVSALVVAGPLFAQVCSGGANGGMDATGNDCSDPGFVEVNAAPSHVAAKPDLGVVTAKPNSPKATVTPKPAAFALRTAAVRCTDCGMSANGVVVADTRAR